MTAKQERGRVRTYRHQRAVAERQLAVDACQEVEPSSGEREDRDRGQVVVVVGADLRAQQEQQDDGAEREAEMAAQRWSQQRPPVRRGSRHRYTTRCARQASSPLGRTMSTAIRMTSAPTVSRSEPR